MTWSFSRDKKPSKRNKQRNRRAAATGRRRPHFEGLEKRELLAVLTVNTDSDVSALDNVLTLREALTVANTNSTATLSAAELAQVDLTTPLGTNDIIQFDSTFFAVPKTIALAGAASLPVFDSVTIRGPGFANLTIDALNLSRVFTITAGDVGIEGMTLTKGLVAADNGGAIFSTTLGTLTVANSKITGNKALTGGGIFVTGDSILNNVQLGGAAVADRNEATAGAGGGLFSSQGNVTLINSLVLGNAATGDGGGINAALGTVSLQNTKVQNNTSNNDGGGIDANSVSLLTSTVSGNQARQHGGGIRAGATVLQNSTVSGNTSGGLASLTGGNGGGIYGTSVIVRNSTIAKNQAIAGAPYLGYGGGIFANVVTLQNATIADNAADAISGRGGGLYALTQLTIRNSIVVGNTDRGGVLARPDISNPALTDVRFSLIGDLGTIPPGANGTQFEPSPATQNDAPYMNFIGGGGGATIAKNTVLETLAGNVVLQNNNGGSPATTETIALIGLAIDKGNNAFATSSSFGDQRGLPFNRISPFGGTVDMGAFEVQTATVGNTTPTLVAPITTPQAASVGTEFILDVAGNFTDANGDDLDFSAARINGSLVSPPGALPSWLSFNQETGRFQGTPTAGDVGQITIQVTATDNKSAPPGTVLPTSTFVLNITPAPVIPPPAVVTLPFEEKFETVVPPALPATIKVKIPSFATTNTGALNDTNSLQATRPSPGARPVATVDIDPALVAATNTFNVTVNVNVSPGNGTSFWSNAVVIFDYQSPTNYKFAGLFQGRDQLIAGKVSNGAIFYSKAKRFVTQANTTYPLSVTIDRAAGSVSVTSAGGPVVTHTYNNGISTGAIGIGTLNANAKFDNLNIV
jgi:predicted outer membrane repeat protein